MASIAVAPDNRGKAAIAVCAGAAGEDIPTPLRSPAPVFLPFRIFPRRSSRRDSVFGGRDPAGDRLGDVRLVSLGDQYFAWGAVSGLISALVVGMVNVVLGSRHDGLCAARHHDLFLGLLLDSWLHSDAIRTPSASAALAVFFAIVWRAAFQALSG